MRIKNFTLLLLAVHFSTVGFAQKSFTVQKDIAYTRQTNAQTFVKQNSLKSEFAATPKGTPSPRTSAKAPAKAPAAKAAPAAKKIAAKPAAKTGTSKASEKKTAAKKDKK